MQLGSKLVLFWGFFVCCCRETEVKKVEEREREQSRGYRANQGSSFNTYINDVFRTRIEWEIVDDVGNALG